MKILTFDTNKTTNDLDLEAIVDLDNSLFPQPWSKPQWEQQLRIGDSFLSIALVDGEIAGFCLFTISKLEKLGHLLKILVRPQYRNSGMAKKLHNSILHDAVGGDLDTLYLEVSTQNISAIKLYENLDYEVLVTKKKFYSNGDDAYAMQRTLN